MLRYLIFEMFQIQTSPCFNYCVFDLFEQLDFSFVKSMNIIIIFASVAHISKRNSFIHRSTTVVNELIKIKIIHLYTPDSLHVCVYACMRCMVFISKFVFRTDFILFMLDKYKYYIWFVIYVFVALNCLTSVMFVD